MSLAGTREKDLIQDTLQFQTCINRFFITNKKDIAVWTIVCLSILRSWYFAAPAYPLFPVAKPLLYFPKDTKKELSSVAAF
ncbi:hypothetical protein DCMF_15355 [Candidatus Formimonas warabiya]|uniref:Uncharacterized protein n=1 Tax=Formimonas warabiya TaxID=1761012 RepID=A0A3G1KU61_FORW1|nr:hypothetical protein DCMF_15355 [Candidatus Formimonas warabiya]